MTTESRTTFAELGTHPTFAKALADRGIIHPFAIQELALPLAMTGADVIGQARTGTGKTLAFGLPLLQRLDPGLPATQALVVVPTRELCLQVTADLAIGAGLGLRVTAVYGGVGYEQQLDELKAGAHTVVGTPGRLLDLLQRGALDLSTVRVLVLDEADEMLDMGFLPDVERLIAGCPQERHTMLFSATVPAEVVRLARRYMHKPTFMRADTEEHQTAPTVAQHFFLVHRMDKPRVLARILQTPGRGGCFVFVRTKAMADRLVEELRDLDVKAIAVHGDLRQATRERNMQRFRDANHNVLVATEVAARGLDVEGVTHVVNYDCPDDEKMYLHRIGRTARAGSQGVAITFAQFNEADRLNMIRKALGKAGQPVPEVFSTSDLLGELFDLPDETPWSKGRRPVTEGRTTDGQQGRRVEPQSSRRRSAGSQRPERAEERPARSAAGRGRVRGDGGDRASTDRRGRDQSDRSDRPVRSDRSERAASAPTGGDRARTRTRTRESSATDRAERPHSPGRARARAETKASGENGSAGRTGNRGDSQGTSTASGKGARRTRTDSPERQAPRRESDTRARAGRSRAGDASRSDRTRGDGTPRRARRVQVEHLP